MNSYVDPGATSVRRDCAVYAVMFIAVAAVLCMPYLSGIWAMAFTDVGNDTFYQFYPLNLEHARQLSRDGEITWSFRLGLGGYVGTHFDPFMWLQGLFPESWQLSMRIYTYLAKLGLAGLAMLFYLRLIGLAGLPVILGALSYAFGDYALINGQWDLHGTELLHFILLAYLLERYLRSGNAGFALLIGLLLGLSHPFNLFTSAFFTVLYLIARTVVLCDWSRWRTRIAQMAGLAILVVIGVLIFAPVNFPSLFYFLESPRVSGDHANLGRVLQSLMTINDFDTVKASFMGFLGKNSMGVANAYSGWANWL